jgi:hypothetical protein
MMHSVQNFSHHCEQIHQNPLTFQGPCSNDQHFPNAMHDQCYLMHVDDNFSQQLTPVNHIHFWLQSSWALKGYKTLHIFAMLFTEHLLRKVRSWCLAHTLNIDLWIKMQSDCLIAHHSLDCICIPLWYFRYTSIQSHNEWSNCTGHSCKWFYSSCNIL